MTDACLPVARQQHTGKVVSVSAARRHTFSKPVQSKIRLLAGLGVENDAHAGATVGHRYRVKQDPTQPNLCQVHLIQEELFHQVGGEGFSVHAGELGENITTHGIDLLCLPLATRLNIGRSAVLEITGLRTPCVQLDRFQSGLMLVMKCIDSDGVAHPRCGIMAIVIASGEVMSGDAIQVIFPNRPYRKLQCV